MTIKFILNSLMLFFFATSAIGQQKYSITGIVKDQKETLPGAAIYVSGSKISTVTNNEGKFSLPNLEPGSYEVLVQMIGYLPYSKTLVLSDKSINFEVVLKQNITQLNEVLVKPDPDRAFHLALFRKFFIGTTENSSKCKILNTHVLITNDDKENKTITVRSDDFLIIENLALGYRIKYLLQAFEYNYSTKMIYYAGSPFFEEMEGNKIKQKKWLIQRAIAYRGSIQHFFKSLYNNTVTEEGFVINKMAVISNKDRLPDSLINVKVKKFSSGLNGITFTVNDSLSTWLKYRRVPKELNVINRQNVLIDTLVKTYNSDLKMMNFSDMLYVIYLRETEAPEYATSSFKINRPPDMANQQISLIQLLGPIIRFYNSGIILETKNVLFSGYFAYEKVADLVPREYLLPVKP